MTFTATVTATPPAAGSPSGTVTFKDGAANIAGCVGRPIAAGSATCTSPFAAAGSHPITAVYSGDTNFNTSTSAVLTQTVNKGNTTTGLASSVNPSVTGQSVTFTATVTATPPAAGSPSGTVTFKDGAANIAGCVGRPIAAGSATCTSPFAAAGSHPITAVYSGDTNFNTSTSAVLTQTVNKGNTTTGLASSVNPSVTGQSVTFTATVTATPPAAGSPSGTVTFKDGAANIAGCVGRPIAAGSATCTSPFAAAGSHPITAVYSGDTNFNTSTSAVLTQTVNKGNTTTGLASSVNPSVTGQSVTFTATVTATPPAAGSPSGTVDFQDGGVSIGGCGAQAVVAGSATCVVTYPGPGSHPITAVYSGDTNFNTSTSAVLTQTVNKGNTTTGLASSVNPSVTGQSVTFTATVTATPPAAGSPSGTVTFKDGAANIAGCVGRPIAAGSATCTSPFAAAGSHPITAVYSGDTNFNTSTSAVLTQTVNKGNTTTGLASSVNPSVTGQSVTFTATVTATPPAAGSPSGTVTFKDGAANIAGCVGRPIAAGSATCTSPFAAAGSHPITAVYSGDTNFNTSTSAVLTQTVNKGNTTTGLASSVNPSVTGQSVTFTATVTATPPAAGSPSGTVTFKDGAANIAGCVGRPIAAGSATCTSPFAAAGSHPITAVYSGDTNFNTSTSAVLTQTVNKGDTTTGLASSVNPSVTGQSVTFTATVTATPPAAGSPSGTVTFKDGAANIAGCVGRPIAAGSATCTSPFAAAGSHPITAVYSGDTNFNTSTSAVLTQTVNKGNTTTGLASSVNPSVTGQSVTFTATVTATPPAAGSPSGTVDFQDGGVSIGGCGAQAVVAGSATCVVTYPGPGSHPITAVYSGDTNFNTSTSAVLTQTVNKGNTTTGLASSVNPSVTGQSVTFTATVTATPPAAGSPSGTVTFKDGAANIAGCVGRPIAAGSATCTSPFAAAGSHPITAVYSGDTNFNTSTSAVLTQTVNKGNTTTGLASSVNPSVTGQSVTFTATVTATPPAAGSPSGTVTFKDGAANIAGCVGRPIAAGSATCTSPFAAAGSHPITAVYSGDTNFNTSTSAVLTQTVNKGNTTTGLASSVNPSVTGQSVTFTATVTATPPAAGSPSGTVTFKDGAANIAGCVGRPIAAGSATCTSPFAAAGSHPITAVYSGDTNFNTSTSAVLTQTVNKGNTTTGLASSVNPSVTGQSVTFTATVTATPPAAGSPSGTVDFQDGGVSIGGCGAQAVVAGSATCVVTYPGPGSHPITAVYSGDTNFNTSTSAVLTQTVNKGDTTTGLASSVNPSVTGQSVTFTATVTATPPAAGSPSGTVDFQDGGVSIGGCGAQAVVAGSATCVVTYPGPGSHPITAVYSGDTNFNTSTSAVLTQTVNKGNTTTGLASSVNPSVTGQSVTFTATVTATPPAAGSPSGTVDFQDGGVSIGGCGAQAVVAGSATCVVTYPGPGSHPITAVYSGDTNFNTSTSAVLTQTVNKGNTTTGLASSVNPSVTGQSVTFTATVTATPPAAGSPSGTVDFQDGGVSIGGCGAQAVVAGSATCVVTYPGPGSHPITAVYSGDTNFNTSTSAVLTQTVNKGNTTTGLASSVNPSVTGQSVTFTATVTATPPAAGSPSGTVDFQDGGVSIGGCGAQAVVAGSATCVVTYPGPGSHPITAVYSGDTNFNTSTSAVLTQTVNKASATAGISVTPSPSTFGKPVTITVSVRSSGGTPTGRVSITDGGVPIGAVTLDPSGQATLALSTLVAGPHYLRGAYAGDSNFTPSTTAEFIEVVKRATTTLTVSLSPSQPSAGHPVVISAVVTPVDPPTGTVTFLDNGIVLGTALLDAGATARLTTTIGAGSNLISADYEGDANYLGSVANGILVSASGGSIGSPRAGSGGTPLAWTGFDVFHTASLGLALCWVGLVLLLVGRRRVRDGR